MARALLGVSHLHRARLSAKLAALAVGPAQYPSPGTREIVVRNAAVAINPLDVLTQSMGAIFSPWTKYPFILGSDVAGEVGAGVTRFKVGDRVFGHAVAADKSRNKPADGGFQLYTILLDHMASPMPEAMAYENAVVLPLAISTAACALFQQDQLALQHPSAEPVPAGKPVLVWGGSTSVGSNAIQLAVAAGYDVISTASPRNFDYVRRLGAGAVFDYGSPTAAADIVRAMKGRTLAGALAIGLNSAEACLDIVHACPGDKRIAMTTPSVSFDAAPLGAGRLAWLIPTMARLVSWNVGVMLKCKARKISSKLVWGTTLIANEVGGMIYGDFLPGALASGRYVAAPEPQVVGHGLRDIPAAVVAQKKGVSARKLVVTL